MNASLSPMLASLAEAPLEDPHLVYEPKYDGIRAIAEVAAKGDGVRLWSRLGNEKTRQFPEVAAALRTWAHTRKAPLVLDGEIVALDANGEPIGFQNLQGRIHLQGAAPDTGSAPVAYIVFDLLRDGGTDYRDRPLHERRAALERLFGRKRPALLRISEQVRGDGRALHAQAVARGWEGLIAKHADSLYKSGKRTPDWRKLKIVREQEFVVGGWTEPRQTRSYFGALLLGVYDGRDLIYVGHSGTGFDEKELARVMKLLGARETTSCPFTNQPKTNERPHWVRPDLVAQVRFTEWTADNKLRHPVYLGLRDDKKAEEVRREESGSGFGVRGSGFNRSGSGARSGSRSRSRARRTPNSEPGAPKPEPRTPNPKPGHRESRIPNPESPSVLDQLSALETARRDGVLTLPDGDTLKVTNLFKVFWPKQKLTKGDLFRYYAGVAPYLLPAVADRPLVMKRFPNGVDAAPFYQHRASDVPAGIRTEVVSVVESRPQIIGGTLKTLLYTTQLAAISQDPWFSRVQHPQGADYAALDLDPSDGVPFERALDVARWIRDELDTLGAVGVPKTSGADGLHVYVPLPPGTPYEAGLIFCQIVATVVAHKHPKVATVERSVNARGKRVYIDCLQNVLGKTLATAYSARASDYAGVSTPLTWQEIDEGVDRRDLTIQTVPERLRRVGDLWAALRKSKGVDLSRVARYADRSGVGTAKGDRSISKGDRSN
jgi:bifunctional non-homologous end joining protein LigD